ncbi:MAG: hypothetical protein HY315_08240 [Acidobacteria bacterium]|nr:hypothetical protein [Acidobacteriota bacterium]
MRNYWKQAKGADLSAWAITVFLFVTFGAGLPVLAQGSMAKNRGAIRISGGGVGYSGYARTTMWLLNNLLEQDPSTSLWLDFHMTARGFRDGLLDLAAGRADASVVNTQGVALMAYRGKGLFQTSIPVRGVAALPSGEWTTFAVDASLGIRSFADLKQKKVPLKITTGYLDGDNAIGFLLLELLRRHGIDPEEFKRWGGQFIEGKPTFTRDQLSSGKANAIFNEAFAEEDAKEIARRRPLNFLSVEAGVARQMHDEYGWPFVTVPAHTYPGQDAPFLAPDFAGWLIVVREDMDDDLAYRLAKIVVEKRDQREAAANYGGVTFPGSSNPTPEDMTEFGRKVSTISIPLHPGAQRYYQEKGFLRE